MHFDKEQTAPRKHVLWRAMFEEPPPPPPLSNIAIACRVSIVYYSPAVGDPCVKMSRTPTVLARIRSGTLDHAGLEIRRLGRYLQRAVWRVIAGKFDSQAPYGVPHDAPFYVRTNVVEIYPVADEMQPMHWPPQCKMASSTRRQLCGALCETGGPCLCQPFPQLVGDEFCTAPPLSFL